MANEDKYLPPIHPGEILKEDFLQPLRMSQSQLAKELGVEVKVVREIVQRRRSIDADMAMRLSRFWGMSVEFWLGLQADYERDCVRYAEQTQPPDRLAFIRRFVPRGAAAL